MVCVVLLMSVVLVEMVLFVMMLWIGNMFGYGDGLWMQIDICVIVVMFEGKVYMNVLWDESGVEVSVYQDGKMFGFVGGMYGWGNFGGNVIVVNSKYVYVVIGVGNECGYLQVFGIWLDKGK